MNAQQPHTEIDSCFSSTDAAPTPWSSAGDLLARAEIFWLTTVRGDGRPHTTPLIAVWIDQTLYFCTGEQEQKARNLARNQAVTVTTGCNGMHDDGFDIVIEGTATRVTDEARLQRLAEQYASKYDWRFTVRNGRFVGEAGNEAVVFQVSPSTIFGFGKGTAFSQTRWRF